MSNQNPSLAIKRATGFLAASILLTVGYVGTVLTHAYVAEIATPRRIAAAAPTPTPSDRQLSNISLPVTSANPASIPGEVTTALANFYAAYTNKDVDRLEVAMTPDANDQDAADRQRLFGSGGNGAQIFQNPEAQEWVVDYTILDDVVTDQKWQLTIQEERQAGDGRPTHTVESVLTLIPSTASGSTWLVQKYTHLGSAGKYDGFLVQ